MDPRLRKLSFTGSTKVGRRLIVDSAQGVLRTSMELGGNAPFLVFEDVDLDAAVDGAIAAKLRNMGEACTAANRFYVQRSIADEFARRLAERMAGLVLGRGVDESTQIGPLIDEKSRDKIHNLGEDARGKGATVLTGGQHGPGRGYFYQPTVLTSVPPEARILNLDPPVRAGRGDRGVCGLPEARQRNVSPGSPSALRSVDNVTRGALVNGSAFSSHTFSRIVSALTTSPLARGGSSRQCPQARDELFECERLGQIIIGAELESTTCR